MYKSNSEHHYNSRAGVSNSRPASRRR